MSASKMFVFCLLSVLYFLVQIASSNNDEGTNNVTGTDGKHYFNESITTVNGQVHIKWSTKSPWFVSKIVNITVYFLTNYTKNLNVSKKVNITTCYARKFDKLWRIETRQGNLLKFCKESNSCGVFNENVTSLIKSYWSEDDKEMGCYLFTSCSNFTSNYAIQILVITEDNVQQSYYFRDLNIYKQNIPPAGSNVYLPKQASNTVIVIQWQYPSQLCNFGSNVSSDIKFVLKYFQFNSSYQCYLVEKKLIPFKTRKAVIGNLSYGKLDSYMFYLSAKSLVNNKTNIFWQKQVSKYGTSKTCNAYNGTMKVSWQTNWQCLDIDLVKTIVFCPKVQPDKCIPVCEITLHKNHSVSNLTSYSENIVKFCHRAGTKNCQLIFNTTDLVHSNWDYSSNTLHCDIFQPCINYVSPFNIKGQTIIKSKIIEEEQLCGGDVMIVRINQPPPPTNTTAVNIGQTDVTLSWHFNHCPHFPAKFQIFLNGKMANVKEIHANAKHVYTHTIPGLKHFTTYIAQVRATNTIENSVFSTSKSTTFKTKEAAPMTGPTIIMSERQGNYIKLSWQLPTASKLRGIPTHFIVAVSDMDGHFIWNNTLTGRNITSTIINGSHIPKCVALKINISICVSQNLCSKPTEFITSKPLCNDNGHISSNSVSGKTWIIAVSVVFGILIFFVLVTWHVYNKRRSKPRQRLPSLSGVPLAGQSDYSNIGVPNQYDSL